jgi:hypothetical protein
MHKLKKIEKTWHVAKQQKEENNKRVVVSRDDIVWAFSNQFRSIYHFIHSHSLHLLLISQQTTFFVFFFSLLFQPTREERTTTLSFQIRYVSSSLIHFLQVCLLNYSSFIFVLSYMLFIIKTWLMIMYFLCVFFYHHHSHKCVILLALINWLMTYDQLKLI